MSDDVAALIADLVRAGVDPDLIGRTAAAIAQREAVIVPDEAAERRRAADRDRKRLRKSAEFGGTPPLLSPSEVPPEPLPTNPNHQPPSPPKGGSSPAGFDEFWAIYPNKVGKADARKAFPDAAAKADLETIMAGLRRYVAKTDDRPWCNPATFLRGERWGDEPATVVPMARGSPPKPKNAADYLGDLGRTMRNAEQGGNDRADAGELPRVRLNG